VNTQKREIIITADGSSTIMLSDLNESYHSINGALAESRHIFIDNGLNRVIGSQGRDNSTSNRKISILETGLGTGLNCLLTIIEALKYPQYQFLYTAIELYPVTQEELRMLNYITITGDEYLSLFNKIHAVPWGCCSEILPNFYLNKIRSDIKELKSPDIATNPDVVYFDAFSPNIQPELWSSEIFKGIFSVMNPGSILVTYSSRGAVKSALRDAGFVVKRVKGPVGKRHITVAQRD
jgi:tRNA U34 5-methylaminomethyl-2-thiouridine-forming methyltransferase MnmC